MFVGHLEAVIDIFAVRNKPNPDAIPRRGQFTGFVLDTAEHDDRVSLVGVVNQYEVLVFFSSEFSEVEFHFLALWYLNFPRAVLVIRVVIREIGGVESSRRSVEDLATVGF